MAAGARLDAFALAARHASKVRGNAAHYALRSESVDKRLSLAREV
jgi:hypothetical protein